MSPPRADLAVPGRRGAARPSGDPNPDTKEGGPLGLLLPRQALHPGASPAPLRGCPGCKTSRAAGRPDSSPPAPAAARSGNKASAFTRHRRLSASDPRSSQTRGPAQCGRRAHAHANKHTPRPGHDRCRAHCRSGLCPRAHEEARSA